MNGQLGIAADRRSFQRDGKPFFYLADTVWSAFSNALPHEWREYLEVRSSQGFNALQINILPQYNRSTGRPCPEPFHRDPRMGWDFTAPNPEYFDRAREMTAQARTAGLIPALAVLWCNHVPGSWVALEEPGPLMPIEAVEAYAAFIAKTFAPSDAVYLVSGDTDFRSPETVRMYLRLLEAMKRSAPDALTTLHTTPDTVLPPEIVRSPALDFYLYQSGHHVDRQDRAYLLAERCRGYEVPRPVVNGEPCYEGIQHYRVHGRYTREDVRRAIWQSLISGAVAGATYGAHGLWCWHVRGIGFPGTADWDLPFLWNEALGFPGAWDAVFARWLFETYGLRELEPAQQLLDGSPEIRVSADAGANRVAIYDPLATEVRLKLGDAALDWVAFELASRKVWRPRARRQPEGIALGLPAENGDRLYIGTR